MEKLIESLSKLNAGWKGKLLVLALGALLGGGVGAGSCAGPSQYMGTAELALGGLEAGANAGVDEAVTGGSMSKCLAWSAVGGGAKSLKVYAGQIKATDTWFPGLPELTIDYGARCQSLMKDGAWRPVLPEVSLSIVSGVVLPMLDWFDGMVSGWVKGGELTCLQRRFLTAIVPYLKGIIEAVVGELVHPDGKLTVPGVTFVSCDAEGAEVPISTAPTWPDVIRAEVAAPTGVLVLPGGPLPDALGLPAPADASP